MTTNNLASFQEALRAQPAGGPLRLFLQQWSFDNAVHLIIASHQRTL